MRRIIDSHCTTVINWTGSEIQDLDMNVGHFIQELLDGGPVGSYEEVDNPADARVSDFWLWLVDLIM